MQAKAGLKRLVGRAVGRELAERLTEFAIAAHEPAVSAAQAERVPAQGSDWEGRIERPRRELWRRTLERIGRDDIFYLEFGVWRGDSIRAMAALRPSPEARFYGFDSFEGLPEDWRDTPASRFDLAGKIPEIDDERVRFVKGWFRDTLPPLLDTLERECAGRPLVVNFDADLYSSTLYLLFALGTRFRRYHFFFDEFAGHETRALFNYMQATGAQAEFFYRVDWEGSPQVVSGELILP